MSHEHDHGVTASSDRRWLLIALLINGVFMLGEVAVGILAGSLALLSDAAHMLTDAFAIGLALVALRLAQRPPKGAFTFGLKRAEILSAQINGVLLLVLAGGIAISAIARIINPPSIDGQFVLWTGIIGAGVNGAAAWALARANRENLNVRGAWLHNLYDMLSSVAAAIAGLVIVLSDRTVADGLAALVIAVVMLVGGWGLVRDSGRVLLEGAPRGLSPDEIGLAMARHPGVDEVHDLHVWEISSGFGALAAHLVVSQDADADGLRRATAEMLNQRFGIHHTTLQVERRHEPELLRIETMQRRQ